MSAPVAPIRRIDADSITTGAAVELDVRPASPFLRVAATLVDVFTSVMTTLLAALIVIPALDRPSQSLARALAILTFATIAVVVPVSVEASTRGRSLGKWAFGLRVVRDDGGVVTVRHCLVRALGGILEIWVSLGSIGLTALIVSPRGKRLGDVAAGTMVVPEPRGRRHPVILMPPDLAPWAQSAVVLGCPPDLQSRALDYLRSNRRMAPAIRERAARDLAERMLSFVETPPPAGADPERLIAAVLVILRDREYSRESARLEAASSRASRAVRAPFGIGEGA
ncbi:RDD family protein [Actinomyces sp. B33]|uniref:RDD family protein n=1 Tax=Actinomyces sp. B33 TaxID=2942131 RepID=UPI0023412529|nr:RDD family protein [Actinomyces sp. B33]MDC4232666.1 RDD family protein [Actinomyces sp. B33]